MSERFRVDPAFKAHPRSASGFVSAAPRVRPPRVALAHDWLTGMRGGEKCLEVLCQLFPDAAIHTLLHDRGSLSPTIEAMTIRTSPLQRLPGIERHYRKLLPIMPWATRFWKAGDVDLVVSLSHCVAKAIRVPPGVPHVCYCFTPMRYAWDARDAYLDAWRERPVRRAAASWLLDRFRRWDRAASANVTEFIAISRTVQDRIQRHYGRESVIIPPPVDALFYTPLSDSLPRGEDYLCVSALVPYKKIDHAIEACRIADRKLVIIGKGPEEARLRALAGPQTRFLGWQPDHVIRDHYRSCRALLFPGEEDFGIVPIEALACGAPVIAFNRGGVAETVDNHLGELYNEQTSQGLAGAIRTFETRTSAAPLDPARARRTAEAFAVEVYEQRMSSLLTETMARAAVPRGPRSRSRSTMAGSDGTI